MVRIPRLLPPLPRPPHSSRTPQTHSSSASIIPRCSTTFPRPLSPVSSGSEASRSPPPPAPGPRPPLMMYAALHAPEHAAAAVECAQAFSPLVEETAAGTVLLEIDGLERLFGAPHQVAAAISARAAAAGFHPHIAIAANPDAALCAARGFPGISIVPEGAEAKFLGSLPLTLLDPPPEIAETLTRWGIRRFRDLAA